MAAKVRRQQGAGPNMQCCSSAAKPAAMPPLGTVQKPLPCLRIADMNRGTLPAQITCGVAAPLGIGIIVFGAIKFEMVRPRGAAG
jgi:hypothetical protein